MKRPPVRTWFILSISFLSLSFFSSYIYIFLKVCRWLAGSLSLPADLGSLSHCTWIPIHQGIVIESLSSEYFSGRLFFSLRWPVLDCVDFHRWCAYQFVRAIGIFHHGYAIAPVRSFIPLLLHYQYTLLALVGRCCCRAPPPP